jgi:hypothetical protein
MIKVGQIYYLISSGQNDEFVLILNLEGLLECSPDENSYKVSWLNLQTLTLGKLNAYYSAETLSNYWFDSV